MNIITISSPNKTKVIERKGTIKESLGFISGYLSATINAGIDCTKIHVKHECIQSNNVRRTISWIDKGKWHHNSHVEILHKDGIDITIT